MAENQEKQIGRSGKSVSGSLVLSLMTGINQLSPRISLTTVFQREVGVTKQHGFDSLK